MNNSNTSPSSSTLNQTIESDQKSMKDKRYLPLLLLNYAFLLVGSLSSSLLSKYYFNHKGSSRWVSTWVQSAGFPLLVIPILLPYYLFKSTQRKPFTRFTPRILALSIFIGFMLGINNLLFAWGISYLPVSTSSLVYHLTLESSNDKPHGLTRAKYFIGYFATIGAGLLFALYLPIMEMVYKKVYCYAMVMEMQLVMEVAATVLATIGMAFDGGFAEMKREAVQVFDKGEGVYWVTVVSNIVSWQLCFMGTAGMVFLTCSLTGAICMTALLMMNVVGGVVVYRDDFGGIKAVSTVMCGWGFCSYVYGMYVKNKMMKDLEHDVDVDDDDDGHDGMHIKNVEMAPMVASTSSPPNRFGV
ncbi:putative purine permease 4 [Hibiscus syriacus]|uniref:Probable purine permease n=1 Tax=Hibiscus syriacus TaxID=106335 RepID=A0A6A3AI56_HIBSY|nr:putative purine permease 4 [Hibiscus syriacus]